MTEELSTLTNAELKTKCEALGLSGFSQLSKAKLIALIEGALETTEATGEETVADEPVEVPEAKPEPEAGPVETLKKGASNTRPAAPTLTGPTHWREGEKAAWITEAYQHALLRDPTAGEIRHYEEQITVGRALYRILEVLAESSEGQLKSAELGETKTNRGTPSEELPKATEEE
tara:strand:+ start:50787 stop:51311 length:525 start_codon:yes stop_codon:yes gene_type:complete